MKQANLETTDSRKAPKGRLAAFVTMLLLAMISMPSGAATPADGEFDNAVQSFRTGRVSAAYGQFQELASRGDADAARIALFMSTYGPLLYGKQWDVLPHDAEYWTILARSNRAVAHPAPEFKPLAVTKKKATPVAVKKQPPAGLALISTRSE
jgi:hypothetical protein